MTVARGDRQVMHGFQRDAWDINNRAALFVGDLGVGGVERIQRRTLGTRHQIEQLGDVRVERRVLHEGEN